MQGIANYIIRRYVPKGEKPESLRYRGKIGMAQGWISIGFNFILFITKLLFGFFANSIALITDSFHSLSDMASSGVVVFGFKMSAKPADKEHPFGHGRAETIAALTIALFIGFAGFECLKTSIDRFMSFEKIQINSILILFVIFSIIIKELMARLSFALAVHIDSDTLKADAVHHRTDMLSSLLVLIALLGVWLGYPRLDAMMGLGVSMLMLHSAYDIARNAIDDLLGKPVDSKTIDEIRSLALKVEGIMNVHDIIVHSYGAHRFISLHVEIPEGLSPECMHEIADKVEKIIADELDADVVTHVDPVTISGKEYDNILKIINDNLIYMELDLKIQDLRIVKNKFVESIHFQLPISVEFQKKEQIELKCCQGLREAYPDCNVMIEFKTQMSME